MAANPLEDYFDINLIETSFALLADQAETLVERFYERLFREHPEVKPLFANTTPAAQRKKLLGSLVTVVQNLRQPDDLVKVLKELGRRHQDYGAKAEHYPVVAGILVDEMKALAGDAWTDEIEQAWSQALNLIASTMLSSYEQTENNAMSDNANNLEVVRLRSALQHTLTAIMMVDRDLVITYVNDSTVELVRSNLAEFQKAFPGFDLKNLVGTCIDDFHKDPSHQRRLLSDPANLPHSADIEVGSLIFNINVTAQTDGDGNYIGNTLEWYNVTEQRAREAQVARLQSSVDSAMTAMMMVDRDLVIQYANDATVELVRSNLAEFQSAYPGFKLDNLIGTCIDDFHKDPSHQRRMLADPANLPHSADIGVGSLTFNINVTAQTDSKGRYIGNTLEWYNVTEQRAREGEVARLQSAVDGAMTAMMMVDRDLVITYANDSTVDLVRSNLDAFKRAYPSFNLDALIGTCIDIFHKNPAHQRAMLSNPDNLPFSTDIKVDNLTFRINVTAQRDGEGNYIGNTLEWNNVTEQRAKEVEVARLQSAVDGAETALMLCDAARNITYVNPSVVELLGRRQAELRQTFPGFDVNKLIGTNIDQFHKNPAHQASLLADPSRLPARAEIKVAGLEFEVNATAILGPDGALMGNMVEWKDITEQKDAERQIANLIEAATRGEFDQKMDAERYTGFIRNLGNGINSLIDAVISPLRECSRVLGELAGGNLIDTMDGSFQGEFAILAESVNTTVVNLRETVEKIRTMAMSINGAASEVSKGNTELSARTEEQASSLEETAASMEEMTSAVQQNADNSHQANQLAGSARDQAEAGGAVVSRAVEAMAAVNESSRKIADIIGVIDEIAFQTNLLALNAAVEAARAGEQGRGFAVVASEVRNLAQRSASAAKEIKSLINDSVHKVNEGSKLVDESGSTLAEIVASVKKVSDIISEIAVASEEQSSGIGQVNQAVTQMDQMTQQNAALVEQAAAASESMDEESRSLIDLMQFFNVGDGSAAMSAAPAAGAARARQQAPAGAASRRQAPPARPAAAAGSDVWEEF